MSITRKHLPATVVVRTPAELMAVIRADWKAPYFGAVPYIEALSTLDSWSARYGADDAEHLALYLLSNATNWRGPVAREVKAEIKTALGIKR